MTPGGDAAATGGDRLARFAGYVAEVLGVPLEAGPLDAANGRDETAVRLVRLGPWPGDDSVDRELGRALEPAARSQALLVSVAPSALIPDPAVLEREMERRGVRPSFAGWAAAGTTDDRSLLAIVDPVGRPDASPAPGSFRVVAVIRTYNEADVIEHTIRALVEDGIDVHILDGWSTDGTLEIAERWSGRGVVAIERFPPEGPSPYQHHAALLHRVERLSETVPAAWFIHHDADERRESPWPDVGLRSALYAVDRAGFDVVDHTVVEFAPSPEPLDASVDHAAQLLAWQFTTRSGHFAQRRAWKQTGSRVRLAASGGHRAEWQGARVYPFKFLLRHYPYRTAARLADKFERERRPRVAPVDRAHGWAAHYDADSPRPTIRPFDTTWDRAVFDREFLVERLSGIGIYQRLYGDGAAPGRWDIDVRVLPWSPSTLEIRPTREPLLDPTDPLFGSLIVSWRTGDHSDGHLFVSRSGEREQPMAQAPDGVADATWIAPNTRYRFRLYSDADRSSLRAEAIVRCVQELA